MPFQAKALRAAKSSSYESRSYSVSAARRRALGYPPTGQRPAPLIDLNYPCSHLGQRHFGSDRAIDGLQPVGRDECAVRNGSPDLESVAHWFTAHSADAASYHIL